MDDARLALTGKITASLDRLGVVARGARMDVVAALAGLERVAAPPGLAVQAYSNGERDGVGPGAGVAGQHPVRGPFHGLDRRRNRRLTRPLGVPRPDDLDACRAGHTRFLARACSRPMRRGGARARDSHPTTSERGNHMATGPSTSRARASTTTAPTTTSTACSASSSTNLAKRGQTAYRATLTVGSTRELTDSHDRETGRIESPSHYVQH